jgi:uncharacterized phage protein gp47/JayE
MTYAPPAVTAAGLTIPSYNDILASLMQSYQAIYGQSVYLGIDSADYQNISVLALKLADNCSLCQLDYNSRSPLTAIGAALDSVVKLNGLVRKPASKSTVLLTLTGTAGTIINNGVVADSNGVYWSLPTTVVLGSGGLVSVTAVCQQTGPISADAGTVTQPVGGFTSGWTGVSNPDPAAPGTPVENDAQLRARQSLSVAMPSSTRLAGTIAGIAAVAGVTRYNVLENQGSVTDSYGNLGHSLTAVVEGGTEIDIATAIYDNRGIGCNTQGATAVAMVITPVTDSNTGVITDIGFVRRVSRQVYVSIGIHDLTGTGAGVTDAVKTAISQALAAPIAPGPPGYLNALQIGEMVTQSALYGVAMSVVPNLANPPFSIRSLTLGFAATPSGTTDLVLQFWEVAASDPAKVIVSTV